MSVARFEPFRDPFREFRSALVHGRERDACPARYPQDVYRGEDGSYHIEADLPGAGLDSVEVTVKHVVLTIQAERTSHHGDSEQVIVAERLQGAFARQLSLGERVDSENLTAWGTFTRLDPASGTPQSLADRRCDRAQSAHFVSPKPAPAETEQADLRSAPGPKRRDIARKYSAIWSTSPPESEVRGRYGS
jgi:HSP20 family molecular chaperone IbpA